MELHRIGSVCKFVSIELPHGISSEGWIESRAEIIFDGFQGQIRPWFLWTERFVRDFRGLSIVDFAIDFIDGCELHPNRHFGWVGTSLTVSVLRPSGPLSMNDKVAG